MSQAKSDAFAKMLEESFRKRKSLEPGALFEAVITEVKDDFIFIQTLNDSIKGVVSTEEFTISSEVPKRGQRVNVFFLSESHGDYYFTTALIGENIHFDNLELAREREIPVWGQVGQEGNGGYEIKLEEYMAFCPFSQIDPDRKSKTLTGSKLKFIVNDINSKTKKITLSQKKISDREKELKKDILKNELKVGSFVTCTIKSIHNFGLIVDMNGFDALVPASEASFKRNLDLNSEFQVGQTLRAKILNMDWVENKISLSLKDSLQDPWSNKLPFKEGDIVSAEVESIKPFGLFVKLDEILHALVPNKETGLPLRAPLASHFKPGDKVEVFILEINPQKRQISASIQKSKEAKERMDFQNYIEDQSVSHVSSFGLLLQKSLKKK